MPKHIIMVDGPSQTMSGKQCEDKININQTGKNQVLNVQ